MIDIAITLVAFCATAVGCGFIWGFYLGRRHGVRDGLEAARWAVQQPAPTWKRTDWPTEAQANAVYRAMLLDANAAMQADPRTKH